ncbi:MAG: S41 family peptidase [Gemmatimonadota bacterium]
MALRLLLALLLVLSLPGSARAQMKAKCDEDLDLAARILYTYWSFVVFRPAYTDLPRARAEFLPEARAARIPDACADVLDRFLAQLDDGHAGLESYPGRTVRTRPNVVLRSIRDGYVYEVGAPQPVRVFVIARDSNDAALRLLEPGSEVLRVDGVGVDTLYGRLHARISGSTPWWRDHIADKILLLGTAESEVTVTFRSVDGTVRELILQRPADPYGYDEKKREKAAREAEDAAIVTESRMLEGGWGYLRVHTFLWKNARRTAERIENALDSLLDRPGLILDLRDNHGGFVDAAVRIAGRFVDRRTVLGYVAAREPKSRYYVLGFHDPKRGISILPPVHAEPNRPTYDGPLVVLVDAGCFSACETLAGGLQSIGRAALVGASPTGGGSGTVTRYRLPSGATITFSVFVSWQSDSIGVEGSGVEPAVTVTEGARDWVDGRDRALEKAIELLETGAAPTLADFQPIKG